MSKYPTIIDVANYAGVSKATVGRVINGQRVREENRKLVLKAIDDLGYEQNVIARSLRTEKTNIIGLSIPDITNPFYPEVVRGIQDRLHQEGYSVVIANSDWNAAVEAHHLKIMRNNRFDGVVIYPTSISAAFQSVSVPLVILGNGMGYPQYDAVGSDTKQGVCDALEHLYELGHRRIGIIVDEVSQKRSSTRYDSYVAFHAHKHLQLDNTLVIHCRFRQLLEASMETGADAMKQLLSLDEPPTAVLAANDIVAIGAMHMARELNWHIPEDISIVGMDNIFASAATSPPLTTVSKPVHSIGERSAHILLERINRNESLAIQHHKLACQLMIRGTTAPPRI